MRDLKRYMRGDMNIFPGAVLKNSVGRPSRVGPMIRSEGRWFGFVPGHMVLKDGAILQAGTDLHVADVVAQPFADDTAPVAPISEYLRLVKFRSYAPISTTLGRGSKCADPIDFLGDGLVLVKNDAMATTAAVVTSVDGPFSIMTSEGPRTYLGAFGLKARDSGVIIGKEGDGGSAVRTPAGQLVGVLIGTADDEYYCAPARQLFARYFPDYDELDIVT